MTRLNLKQARELFESEYGRRISDATWYRTVKVFNDNFPMTRENIVWLAEIKTYLPKCDLRSVSVVESVRKTRIFINQQNPEISGAKLLEFFKDYDIKIHPNTLTKWFRPIHGFRRTRIYTLKELTPIILAAHTYKVRRETTRVSQSLTNIK